MLVTELKTDLDLWNPAAIRQLAARLYDTTPEAERYKLRDFFHALARECEKLYQRRVLDPDFARRLGAGSPPMTAEDIGKLF